MNENPINPNPPLNGNPYPAQPAQPAQASAAPVNSPSTIPLQVSSPQPEPSLTPGPQIIYPTNMQPQGSTQPAPTALPTPSVSQAPIYKAAEPTPVPLPVAAATLQTPQHLPLQPAPTMVSAQNPLSVQPPISPLAPAIQTVPVQPMAYSDVNAQQVTPSQIPVSAQDPELVALGLTQPAPQAVNPSGYLPSDLQPQKKISKKTVLLISLVSILVLLGGGGAGFYFLYWTKSSVVYSRSQKQISNIFTNTLSSESKLLNDTELLAEVSAESANSPLIAKISSRILDSGSESNAAIEINKTVFNIGLMTTNNTDKTTSVYLKYKNIEQLFKSVQDSYKDSTTGTSLVNSFQPYIDVLKKYDDKWITLNVLSLISGDEKSKNETITQEDYEQVIKSANPIISSSLIGLDKSKAVFQVSNARTEKVAGKSAWAYDMEIDSEKFNAMIDELKTAIDKTTLSDAKKKVLKEGLEDEKIQDSMPSEALIEASQTAEKSEAATTSDTPATTETITEATGTGLEDTATTETISETTDVGEEASATETDTTTTISTSNIQQKSSTSTENTTSKKITIWLEKLTALPIKLSINDTASNDGKKSQSNEQTVEITKFTKSTINGAISLSSIFYDTSEKEKSKSTATAKFSLDNKLSKLVLDGKLDPNSTANNDTVTYKLELKPNTNKSAITAPTDPIDFQKFSDDLSKISQSLNKVSSN